MENHPRILCIARALDYWQNILHSMDLGSKDSLKMLGLDESLTVPNDLDLNSVALTILDWRQKDSPSWDDVYKLYEKAQSNSLLILASGKPPDALLHQFQRSGLGMVLPANTTDPEILQSIEKLLTQQRLTKRAVSRAFLDEVTQLPGADLFRDRFETAVHRVGRLGFGFGLALCDIDGFKAVNQENGYRVGDLVLRQVGKRFQDRMRKSDTTARLGGDLFALIFENVIQDETLKRLAEKVFDVMMLPYLVSESDGVETREIQLNFSMGLCLFPQHLTEPEKIMAAAESALAEAKQKPGSSIAIYEPPEGFDDLDLLEANG